MKIGLISINTRVMSLNFACPLHTYAFQQFLLQNGIESTVIDYKPSYYSKAFTPRHPLFYYIENGLGKAFEPEVALAGVPRKERARLKKELALQREKVKRYVDLFYEREIRHDKFEKFVEDNYVKTEKCYNWKMLDKEDPGFDCYICVTDVIWKSHPTCGFDKGFFLACRAMEGKKKIAYSASRGPYHGWSDETIQQFKEYIEDFDYISVREPSLKEHIESISDKKAEVVLDPIFLQDKEFYHRLAVPPKEKGYVLLYIVMERARDSIANAVRFAESRGLKVIELSENKENANIPEGTWHEVRYGLGVEEWLGYIEHADYVFTNSFHCCGLSILFEKEVFVGDRHGDKLDVLLDTLGLTWRRLKPEIAMTTVDIAPIDYGPVREIIKEKRAASEKFILDAIHSVEKDCPDQYERNVRYRVGYYSGAKSAEVACDKYKESGKSAKISEEGWEYRERKWIDNKLVHPLEPNGFERRGYVFSGWNGWITVGKQEWWYCTDENFHTSKELSQIPGIDKYLFRDEEEISKLPLAAISPAFDFSLNMRAVWKKNTYSVIYHSGAACEHVTEEYSEMDGKVRKTPRSCWEYVSEVMYEYGKPRQLEKNGFHRQGYIFSGWNARIDTAKDVVLWYCTDGAFHTRKEINNNSALTKRLLHDGEELCFESLPGNGKRALVFEAIWKKASFWNHLSGN